jgi:3-oxoacyl-[acyl-carrier-protein] synthase-1
VFLYTLPNITTGEIAIRHGIKGETSLYILPENDASLMHTIVESTFALSPVKEMITGWVDCSDANQFEANIKLLTIE